MATNWKQERKNLGVDPDVKIAKRLGVTKERVRQERKKLSIPRTPRQLRRSETAEELRSAGSIVKHLRTIPLSARDRQTITDVRMARGWSQKDVAEKIDSSVVFYSFVETGRKAPSPDYLSRVCKVLGLEWSCQFWLQVGPKRAGRSRGTI
jgi:ribosome-binding protein aMBF1 (putative translation factor)